MSHECPRNGCTRQVPDDLLLCAADFRPVPIPLRRALYQAWDPARGRGSAAHQAAADAVLRYVNGEPEPAPKPSPHALWERAGGGTGHYSGEEYRRLMREHGHLLKPGDAGYEDGVRSAPCGWKPKTDGSP